MEDGFSAVVGIFGKVRRPNVPYVTPNLDKTSDDGVGYGPPHFLSYYMEGEIVGKQTARSNKSIESHLFSGRRSLHFPCPHTGISILRQHGLSARGIIATRRQEISHAILDGAHGFPYSRKLESHRSCVNALTFSSKDGRFLASGGDDLRICLWDFHQDDVKAPSYELRGPKGNIFCLEFSASNRFLFTAGTCETIYKYDVGYLGLPSSTTTFIAADQQPRHVFEDNDDSLRSISCHPVQDEIFMTASEDGTIHRYDVREDGPRTSQDTIQTVNEVTDVKYHPTMEHLFLSSDGAGHIHLHDSRMAFTPLIERSKNGIVQEYNTKLVKKSCQHMHLANPESSSITFDRDGTKFAATFLHYLPTIYAVSDPDPVAILSGKNLPDGTPISSNQTAYSNSCTMKHGSFGGPALDVDDMYAAGSDDFHCYVWKIPPLPQLLEKRKIFSTEDWLSDSGSSTIAFTEGRDKKKVVPAEIPTPLSRLTGHNSIVNTALFHPHFLHLVTAGVEKNIIIHSPTPSSPCTQNLQPSPTHVRKLKDEDDAEDRRNYYSAILIPHSLSPDREEDRAERQTLSLFDHIIRTEGDCDVFATRSWSSPDSSDADDDDDSDKGGGDDDDEDVDDSDIDSFVLALLRSFGPTRSSS